VLFLSLVQGTIPTGIVEIVTTLPFTLCLYVITTATKIGDRKTDGVSFPRISTSLRVYSCLFPYVYCWECCNSITALYL